MGLGICYDIRFAELAQIYSRRGIVSFSDYVVNFQKKKNFCQFKHNFLLTLKLVCNAHKHFHHHQFER